MDVAYRLCPEVDIYGMIGDVKRAVAWMKANAARYQVNPERIVLGGGSAGGHLALLAAYAPHHPLLTPPDVQGCDLSVRAVVSYYGPTDLRAVYEHTHQKQDFGSAAQSGDRIAWRRGDEEEYARRGPIGHAPGRPSA